MGLDGAAGETSGQRDLGARVMDFTSGDERAMAQDEMVLTLPERLSGKDASEQFKGPAMTMDDRSGVQDRGSAELVSAELVEGPEFESGALIAMTAALASVAVPPAEDSKAIHARRFDIVTDASRDALLTVFGKDTLDDRYLLPGEAYQDLFARVADAYADDQAHAQRLYDYISKLWFMPATPVLSNGGTGRGLPISCYLNSVSDSLEGIVGTWNENVWLASRGGGIGTYWGKIGRASCRERVSPRV